MELKGTGTSIRVNVLDWLVRSIGSPVLMEGRLNLSFLPIEERYLITYDARRALSAYISARMKTGCAPPTMVAQWRDAPPQVVDPSRGVKFDNLTQLLQGEVGGDLSAGDLILQVNRTLQEFRVPIGVVSVTKEYFKSVLNVVLGVGNYRLRTITARDDSCIVQVDKVRPVGVIDYVKQRQGGLSIYDVLNKIS